MDFDKAEIFIAELIEEELPPDLFYHNYEHTQDVMQAAMHLAHEEHVTDVASLVLLKTAALFHDCGYVNTYSDHEEESCRIASDILPGCGYTEEQIETICKMIMKTKMPFSPQTHFEKILCDADLDYLGRGEDEYFEIASKLYDELEAKGKVADEKEWDLLQVQFLESHHYWTQSARNLREKQKAKNLRDLKEEIKFKKYYPNSL